MARPDGTAVLRRAGRALADALVTGRADPPSPTPRRWRVGSVDVLVVGEWLAVIVLLASTASLLTTAHDELGGTWTVPLVGAELGGEVAVLAAMASSLPLLLRRHRPLLAWRIATVALLLVAVPIRELQPLPVTAAGVLTYGAVLVTIGSRCQVSTTVAVGVVTLAGVAAMSEAVEVIGLGEPEIAGPGWALVAACLVVGQILRSRRRTEAQLADQQRQTEQERAARAILQERARIARELHDVVAHHMSVIAIQAEAAPLQTPDAPEAVKADLAQIRATALEALTEMRRILGVLREGDTPDAAAPQPGLDRLDDLLASARAGGLHVTLAGPPPTDVPPGVGLSAYRIVQESLSNAMRHAPGADVTVALDDHGDQLDVSVTNGPARRPTDREPDVAVAGAGIGLTGMRERAAMLGGELLAGPTADGGFAVTARLPLHPTDPSPARPRASAEDRR